MSDEGNKCDICKGKGKFMRNLCQYCNGTGEWNSVAQAYIKNHICQCIVLDRKNCPICHKKCHHSSAQSGKQVIDPGHGGQTVNRTWDRQEADMEIEMSHFA